MRIISGALRGKKLVTFRGDAIRPTSDRIKESIFNILSGGVQGKHVLDLFAGTGNLAIEALSRGADTATLIDHDKRSLSVIQRNIDICRLQSRARAIQWDIKANLRCVEKADPGFDLVFMDPPYHDDLLPVTFRHLYDSAALAPGAILIVEHPSRFELPADFTVFQMVDHRRYGKTLVSFFGYMI